MLTAGWLVSDYSMVPDGIRVWTTDQQLIEITVDCLAAYLENGDPMPTGDIAVDGSDHTIINLDF